MQFKQDKSKQTNAETNLHLIAKITRKWIVFLQGQKRKWTWQQVQK